MEGDGLLSDLQGVPCPRVRKRCFNNVRGPDINLRTVWHKCDRCGVKQLPGLHNPLFAGFMGKGSYGVSYAVWAFWNCVQGVHISVTVRQLNINEKTCLAYYDRGNLIMAAEARRLQKLIAWGTGTPKTVEVEIDATVICKWRVVEDGHKVIITIATWALGSVGTCGTLRGASMKAA
jgi:hypothetical protein